MNHSFDIDDAQAFGIPAAVLIENFRFWISKNRANDKHLMEGRTWSYNSVKAFQELFPYMGIKQIRAALDKLVDAGVLMKRDWNEGKADRTLWYAFRDEEAFIGPVDHLPKKAIGMPKRDKASAQKGEPTNKTDINTDINAYLSQQRPAGQAQAVPAIAEKIDPVAYLFPLNDGTTYGMVQSQVDQFAALYPAVNIDSELRACIGWNIANETRRKTRSGILRHINSWLTEKQNKPAQQQQNQPRPTAYQQKHDQRQALINRIQGKSDANRTIDIN